MRILLCLIMLILYQGVLEDIINLGTYIDEGILIILLVYVFSGYTMKKIEIKLYKLEKLIFILICIFFVIGIISNMNSELIEKSKDYIISGILFIKIFLIYILARIAFRNIKINKNILLKFSNHINIILNIYVILILANIPLKFLKVYDTRFNIIETISVGFGHPSELDFFAISIMIIQLFLFRILNFNMKKYLKILLKVFIIIIFTGRIKAIIFYVGYILAIAFSKIIKNIKIYNIIPFIPFIPIFYSIGKERLLSEILDSYGVRGILYKTAFHIASDFWPFGGGFGTFGTEFSRKIYSPLYYKYNISSIYGLSPDWPAYITDSNWAAVIGETGFLGMFIYILICIIMTVFFIFLFNKDTYIRIALSSLWIYGIIASFSDTILMGYRGTAIVIITTFFISVYINKESSIYN